MKVQDIMHKGVIWVHPDESVSTVARRMKRQDVGAIPVGENDRLIGMITDRDICCRAVGNGRDIKLLTARDVMTRKVSYCMAGQKVDEAVAIMKKAKVRRLPVINEKHRMIGFLGLGDISAKAPAKTAAAALKALAAHHA